MPAGLYSYKASRCQHRSIIEAPSEIQLVHEVAPLERRSQFEALRIEHYVSPKKNSIHMMNP